MDGVQDACEPPVTDLTVVLYTQAEDGTLTQVDMTTTDPVTGEYYFEDVDVNTDYLIVFQPEVIDDSTYRIDGVAYTLAGRGTGAGDNPDQNDSDAMTFDVNGATLPSIMYRTGIASNLDQDIGFAPVCPTVELADDQPAICSSNTIFLADLVDMVFDTSLFTFQITTDGTGTFDTDDDGDENPATATFNTATSYTPSAADASRGSVTFTVTATEGFSESCPPATDATVVQILKVDCGEFFWEGSND